MTDAPPGGPLQAGRDAYRRREWQTAFRALTDADDDASLSGDDLRRLAEAAYLVGEAHAFVGALERAHHRHLDDDDPLAAARDAFWLGLHTATVGEMGRASGWFGRMGRLVEGAGRDCVEQGLLLIPRAHQLLVAGDPDAAARTAARAAEIAQRFGDPDLLAFALHVEGRALLRQGRVADGLARLDEAMVAVASDELSPQLTGLIYCSVISACREVYAIDRANEWTEALSDWCERQPDMVAYTGECRLYRAEIMRLRGEWRDAIREVHRARERLAATSEPGAVSLAHYQQGEVHRLRGELAAAEEAYREASRAGREPLPGLALLRLAQGDTGAAEAASRRAIAETRDRWRRARLLPAHIEILIAAGDTDEAARACQELEEIAGARPADGAEWPEAREGAGGEGSGSALDALVDHARGAVLLARGHPDAALPHLRQAWRAWQAVDAPYDAARVRELIGRACRALGDEDTAALELDAARAAYDDLGAAPDRDRILAEIRGAATRRRSHGLTPRELEVLAQVATGRTNRAIAEELFISEKTVARHVANIFAKLGLSSRAAATAYAYEHDLLGPSA